ncbi:MAG: 50S ribosome-binding GTPase, partial [Anaerolineae bacterium]|nr:50S ribosome-binding GTPase [Anaerolineae bacterium]
MAGVGEGDAVGENRETLASVLPGVQRLEDGGVFLIDTPGIDEVGGEARERLAREVAGGADLILFVCEGDLTATELNALRELAAEGTRPIVLALNKTDR